MGAIEEQAAAATAQIEQMKANYAASPDQVAARAREALARFEGDPDRLGRGVAAERERSMLQSNVKIAESKAEAVRVEAAILGDKINLPGMIETTINGQLPMADMISAVEPLIESGMQPVLLKNFLETGRSGGPDDRKTEIALARQWLRKLETDPSMQAKLLAKDPEVWAQFQAYGVYAPWPHEQ